MAVSDEVRQLTRRHVTMTPNWPLPFKWATSALRLALGWIFLYAGGAALYATWTSGVSATSGFLEFATFGPFSGFFRVLAGNSLVDALFVWGLFLSGLGLILGALTRVAAMGGATIMLLIYFSAWPPGPVPFVDDHVIYALTALLLAFMGAGRFLGLDGWIESLRLVQRHPAWTAVLG